MAWILKFTKQAEKDAKKLKSAGLEESAKSIIARIANNPYDPSDGFEKLSGDLAGFYSRRLTYHDRIVYEVFKKERIVRIARITGHY